MKNKKYFVIIDPYVYFLHGSKNVFFYNTLNRKYMESTLKSIVGFFKDIQDGGNLSVKIIYENDLLKDMELKKFIYNLREGFFGDIIELKKEEKPPIQLYPILALKKTNSGKFDFTGEQNTIDYLKSLNIYLNNKCNLNCTFCNSAYKQFLSCGKKSDKTQELEFSQLAELIKYLNEYPNINFSLLGGDVFLYSKFNDLIKLITTIKNKVSFFTHYENLFNNLNKLYILKNKNFQLNILVDFPVKKQIINKILLETKKNITFKFIFLVKHESELEQLNMIIDELKINNFSTRPYFNGRNKTFFRNYVYFNKTQVLNQELSIKDIFFNMVFNKNTLGDANILSNGDYYINLNNKKVGNINKESINDIVNNELTKNGDWFLTRNKVKPCKGCNYKFLCPPIANYEFSIGAYNLCNIRK